VTERDEVDRIVAAWRRERPDLDFSPFEVLSRVTRLAKLLDRARRGAFAASELQVWEFDVLSALRRAGDPYELSPSALAAETLVSSGTMTNRLDRLEARGLVLRRGDPTDRRAVIVALTASGRGAVDAAVQVLVIAETRLLSGLEPGDRERIADGLRRLGR
jgi:DNA-binding MarR family transcriptional regulator